MALYFIHHCQNVRRKRERFFEFPDQDETLPFNSSLTHSLDLFLHCSAKIQNIFTIFVPFLNDLSYQFTCNMYFLSLIKLEFSYFQASFNFNQHFSIFTNKPYLSPEIIIKCVSQRIFIVYNIS